MNNVQKTKEKVKRINELKNKEILTGESMTTAEQEELTALQDGLIKKQVDMALMLMKGELNNNELLLEYKEICNGIGTAFTAVMPDKIHLFNSAIGICS